MTNILIRADASLLIGSGHVIRCRTLARELTRRGGNVRFLCRRQPGDLINLLQQEFTVFELPEQALDASNSSESDFLQGRNLYAAWLGCSQEQDAADCLQVLYQEGLRQISWVVVDHYGLDEIWESQLLSGLSVDPPPRLLVIDDLADRRHHADCLLDQNFFGGATESRYKCLVPEHCQQLLGPHYAMIGREYAQLHPLVPARIELNNVLVFFGGVDSANLTEMTIEALMDPALVHLSVDVVLGRQTPLSESLSELVTKRPHTTLHRPLPSLAGLITKADLAIGAAGATTWERACLRLPSILIATADNQLPFAKALNQAGHLQLLGIASNMSAELIRTALLDRVSKVTPPPSVSPLTDGFGTQRICIAMLGSQETISLRLATVEDKNLLLQWTNEKQSFECSTGVEDAINTYDHNLLDGLHDRLVLIATESDGCPIGKISFCRQPAGAQCCASEVTADLLLDRCAYGHGLATELIRLGLELVETDWESKSNVEGKAALYESFFVSSRFDSDVDLDYILPFISSVANVSVQALQPCHITLVSDRESWLNSFLPSLIASLWKRGHSVRWIHDLSKLTHGDVSMLLSCSRLLSQEQLSLHSHNLVVHESDLPQGKGWSPMTWQILEGASTIPVTLFEATATCDDGLIYLKQNIDLQGFELVNEWRELQAQATIELCLSWFDGYRDILEMAKPQCAESTYYKRRRPVDSLLDIEGTISDQFNLLRVVDNQRYPAYFRMKGRRYSVEIKLIPEDLL